MLAIVQIYEDPIKEETNDYQSHVCRIIVIPVTPDKEQNSKNIKQTDQMTINLI